MTVSCALCGETWPRHPVLEVSCPCCGAGVGTWCRRPSGHRAAELHVDRERKALQAGVIRMCPEGPSAKKARRDAVSRQPDDRLHARSATSSTRDRVTEADFRKRPSGQP